MWAETDFHEEVKGNPVPVLVNTGRHDLPVFQEEAISTTLGQWRPRISLAAFQGSGHHPMVEEPIHFVTVTEEFMREQSGPCCNGTACATA